jgi:hypothetical protein
MRSFGVCAILLGLCVLAPPPAQRGPFEPLWALGALLLLGVTLQNVAGRLRLPPLAAWIAAGVVLGPGALDIVDPRRLPPLGLALALSALWAAMQAGLGARWERRSTHLLLVVALSTLATFGLLIVGLTNLTSLSPDTVLLLAAFGSLWCPLVCDGARSREAQIIAFVGLGSSWLLLAAVVGLPLDYEYGALRLLGPALAGALAAEGIVRLRLIDRRGRALWSLSLLTLAAVLLADRLVAPVIPFGLAAGLVLALRQGSGRQLEHLLAPTRPISTMLLAGLLAASFDVRSLWPLPEGLLDVVALQIVVLVLLRGIGPALWYPLPPAFEFSRRSGWLLLPRGLSGAEIALGASAFLSLLLPTASAHLLRAVLFADLLIYGLLFASLAHLLPLTSPAVEEAPEQEREGKPESVAQETGGEKGDEASSD